MYKIEAVDLKLWLSGFPGNSGREGRAETGVQGTSDTTSALEEARLVMMISYMPFPFYLLTCSSEPSTIIYLCSTFIRKRQVIINNKSKCL